MNHSTQIARTLRLAVGLSVIAVGLAKLKKYVDDRPQDPHALMRFERWLSSQPAAPLKVSPDGRLLLSKTFPIDNFELRITRRMDGQVVSRIQSRNKPAAAFWAPSGNAIAFLADSSGNQRYRPHVLSLNSGSVRRLNGLPTGTHDLKWSQDGRNIGYMIAGPGKGGRALLILRHDSDAAWADTLISGLTNEASFAWSSRGEVAVVRRGNEGSVSILSRNLGEKVVAVVPGAQIRDMVFSPDARNLAVSIRTAEAEFFQIVEVALEGGTVSRIAAPTWDAYAPTYTKNGEHLWYHVNVDGEAKAVRFDRSTRQHALVDLPGTTLLIGSLSSGDSVFFSNQTATGPPTLEGYSVRSLAVRSDATLGEPTPPTSLRVDIPARDGLRLPGYLFRPDMHLAPKAVLMVHGGPALQSTPAWDPAMAYLVESGYTVLQLNYRGSTGYGRRLESAPTSASQGVTDIIDARTYLSSVLGIPTSRIIAIGFSYGASLVLRAAAQDSVSFGGVVLVSLAGTVPAGTVAVSSPQRLWSFQGVNDISQAPRSARAKIESVFGGPHIWRSFANWEEFDNEGHIFRHTRTLAKVYGAALAY